jgi:hypothetical protein
MDKRQFRGQADTELLMATKRIVPRRETEEHDAAASQETMNVHEEMVLIRWRYVFNDIVNKYQVEAFGICRWLGIGHKVMTNESTFLAKLLKKRNSLLYPPAVNIDARYGAVEAGKRQQVAAFTAAYFQHSGVICNIDKLTNVTYIKVS